MDRRAPLVIGLTLALASPAPAPIAPAPDPIAAALGVRTYSLQKFDAPAHARDGFKATLELDGRPVVLSLEPESVYAPGCKMLIDEGTGELIVAEPPDPCTYTGSVLQIPGSSVSASLIEGRLSAVILEGRGRPGWSILPLSDVVPGAHPTVHIVCRDLDIVPTDDRCGLVEGPADPLAGARVPSRAPRGTLLRCQLACEADNQYYIACGSNASATAQDIAGVVNNASNYYKNQVGVVFKITRFVIRTNPATNPYTSSNASTLLGQVRTLWNSGFGNVVRDTMHLFTGRDLEGSTVGLAYKGVVCETAWAYGLSQSKFAALPGKRAGLTAHEIGHNFDASHCDAAATMCSPCYIMAAQLGNAAPYVTSFGCSAAGIASYAAGLACLDPLDRDGSPCPGDLNGDGRVDVRDAVALQRLLAHQDPAGDVNGDGAVDVRDLVAFQVSLGSGCR